MALENKIKDLIKNYEVVITEQEELMADNGEFEEGTYNEMQAELDCYIIFKGVLEDLLEGEK